MDPVYIQLRERACRIVSACPRPGFYRDCADACAWSRNFYLTDPIIARLKRFVTARLSDDFGHGLRHAAKVTLDAGALVVAESGGGRRSDGPMIAAVRHVQCAGLLHDIERSRPDHALAGALSARRVLRNYPLPPEAVADICSAISNHEAFKDVAAPSTPAADLIDACLYDADKFRWGPDNFTDTIWDMVTFARIPPAAFVHHYPRGMESLERIRGTFRSPTGRRYGPEFIDIGIEVGWRLYDVILEEFAAVL
jgi:Predicted HD superfamily hydrolase